MRRAAAVFAAGLLAGPAAAGRSAGASSLIIGKMSVGTRAIALAGAYTALAEDPSALWWNPAGLAGIGRARVDVLHVEETESVRVENVLAAQPLPRGLVAAAGLGYLSVPPVEEIGEDAAGDPVVSGRSLNAFEFKAAGALAGTLSAWGDVPALGAIWSQGRIGAAATVLGDRIGGSTAASAALDLGYQYDDTAEGRSAGLVVRQLGPPSRGRPLAATFQGGLAQRIEAWLFSLDVLTAVDDALRVRGGVEWTWDGGAGGAVALRGGLQHSFSSDLIAPWAAGLGYRFALGDGPELGLEYAFSPVRGFGQLHAASLAVGW